MNKPGSQAKINFVIKDKRWKKLDVNLKEATQRAALLVFADIGFAIKNEFTVMLTNDEELQGLNKNFRGKDKPTNVLSFPSFELKPGKLGALLESGEKIPYIGDVAISYDRVNEEISGSNKSFADHYTHLITHSILHLLGYDHIKPADARVMENKEIMVLKKLGIANPYKDNNKCE